MYNTGIPKYCKSSGYIFISISINLSRLSLIWSVRIMTQKLMTGSSNLMIYLSTLPLSSIFSGCVVGVLYMAWKLLTSLLRWNDIFRILRNIISLRLPICRLIIRSSCYNYKRFIYVAFFVKWITLSSICNLLVIIMLPFFFYNKPCQPI